MKKLYSLFLYSSLILFCFNLLAGKKLNEKQSTSNSSQLAAQKIKKKVQFAKNPSIHQLEDEISNSGWYSNEECAAFKLKARPINSKALLDYSKRGDVVKAFRSRTIKGLNYDKLLDNLKNAKEEIEDLCDESSQLRRTNEQLKQENGMLIDTLGVCAFVIVGYVSYNLYFQAEN